MKNILYTIILSLLFSFSVFADFEVGMDAYKQGDYAIALKEFNTDAPFISSLFKRYRLKERDYR